MQADQLLVTGLTQCLVGPTQDVTRLGQKGEVRDASAGWVRHHLFPQGKVLYATPENVEAHAMVRDASRLACTLGVMFGCLGAVMPKRGLC
jgi:hypothetical protein